MVLVKLVVIVGWPDHQAPFEFCISSGVRFVRQTLHRLVIYIYISLCTNVVLDSCDLFVILKQGLDSSTVKRSWFKAAT